MSSFNSISIVTNTIGALLGIKTLSVPPSQRSYRWKDEHIEDLFQDIQAAIGGKEYFLGSVVSIETSDGKTQIFDGQQRLATTMILIGAIRDYFLSNGDEKTAGIIEGESLISERRAAPAPDPHFRLNSEDAEFFEKRILRRPSDSGRKGATAERHVRDSHKRIEAAAKLAAKRVKLITDGRNAKDAVDQLNAWLDFIKEKLTIIWVKVAEQQTAYRIFETMNDRGLKLSAADLLKNYLHAMSKDRSDEVIQKWSTMTGTLETIDGEEENIVEYVRCFWITKHGHTRTKDLFDHIKETIISPSKALELASELEVASQDYAAIVLSSHERLSSRGEGVRTKIANIRHLGVTQVRPLILAAFKKFKPQDFSDLLDGCIAWSVRALIAGTPSGSIETTYSKCAHEITQGVLTNAAAVKKVVSLDFPDDVRFQAAFSTATVSNSKLARYYLRAMQRYEDKEDEPQYIPNPDGTEITLEHILPQVPEGNWNYVAPDDHKRYYKRIGNMALLGFTDNSRSKSDSYEAKKPVLAASEYSLTRQAAKNQQRWEPSDIDERQARLAELAVKTWPLR